MNLEALEPMVNIYVLPLSVIVLHQVLLPGSYSATIELPFQSKILLKLFVFFVESEAFLGTLNTNPYLFSHYDVRSIAFLVDGVSVPGPPLETNFHFREISSAYNSLLDAAEKNNPETEFEIGIDRFIDGTTIFGFNLDYGLMKSREAGHTKLEIKFGTPLPHNVNVILAGTFKSLVSIDHARNVTSE